MQQILVRVEGLAYRIAADTDLEELLALAGYASTAVAVAVCGAFVPRGERCNYVLRDGDEVACFRPIVGG